MFTETVTKYPLIFSLRDRKPDQKVTVPLSITKANDVYQDQMISICQKGKIELISPKDVTYVKAESNYIRIFMVQGHNIMLAKTLKQVSVKLQQYGFVRVHKSYAVHPLQIHYYNISDGTLVLHSGKEIPVSRSHRKFVTEIYTAWAL